MKRPQIRDAILQDVSRIFGCLGDASRLKILRALMTAPEPLCQGVIASRAGLSQANASKHLAQLVRAGLVTREHAGTLVRFSPVTPIVGTVCDLVCGHVTARIEQTYLSVR